MECPHCQSPNIVVTNSRATKGNTQIWRRRRCLDCGNLFTTHEIIDLSHLMVIKKSDKTERFSRLKLYSGIYCAIVSSDTPNRELIVDKITREIEKEILALKKKRISSAQIADIALFKLRKFNTATFLRFLAYCKDIQNESQMRKELAKYLRGKRD